MGDAASGVAKGVSAAAQATQAAYTLATETEEEKEKSRACRS